MANKFPDWVRPDLSQGQLSLEEKRLVARGLTPEQIRADLILLLANAGGETPHGCATAGAGWLGVSVATVTQFLKGANAAGDLLIQAMYGTDGGSELTFDEMLFPMTEEEWGPMLPGAIAAGLIDASGLPADEVDATETNSQTDAGAPSPPEELPAPAAAGAAEPDPDAPAASPVVATALPPCHDPAPEPAPDPAPPAPVSTIDPVSPRAPEPAVQDGEGTLREGSTIPAGPQGQSPVQLRDAAGEGFTDTTTPPPPHTNSFTRVLDELQGMFLAAHDEVLAAQTAEDELLKRIQLARAARDALLQAIDRVREAHDTALKLINNPPVTLAERRAA